MRETPRARLLTLLLLGVAAWGCGSPPPAPKHEPGQPALDQFSEQRVWADLQALTAVGPRPTGSKGSRQARLYLREQLAKLEGVEVQEVATPIDVEGVGHLDLRHVVASVPGTSPDLFVLVAPYDSSKIEGISFVGANDGASGAAVVLELVRVLSHRGLPYGLRALFLDGEGRLGRGEGATAEMRGIGSRAMAARMDSDGELAHVRLLVAFNRVCDADLRIARDIGSHRMHREEFWKAAAQQGHEDAFVPGQPFESLQESHVAFRERGVRPVVAIADSAFGGDAPPGIYADTEQDDLAHCAPQSLATVGQVAVEAIETIAARLEKIDRFTRSPLAPIDEPRQLGGSGGAPGGGSGRAPAPARIEAVAPDAAAAAAQGL
jgi:Peptidase family M28